MLGIEIPNLSILSSDYLPKGIAVFMVYVLAKVLRWQMVTFKSYYALCFLGFSTVHRKLVMELLSGSNS